MDFIHKAPGDTIAAIATPPGNGGVAIIRLSGNRAIEISDKVFSGPVAKYPTHTVHFGKIVHGKEILDEGLLIPMHGPRSFTGEDVVEIHCHGGALIAQKVLAATLSAGARAAGPGEFSHRAFQNGKIDLAQAEAIQALIASKNTLALDASRDQLSGRLSTLISAFQKELTQIYAILEAWVDFPEEDLAFAPFGEIISQLTDLQNRLNHLASTFQDGRHYHTGYTLCLLGKPNVGKSSLLNALIGHERAIVTPIAGTTRDLIEEEITLGDLHLRLIDTAGLRHTDNIIEQEGVKRSTSAAEKADLILHIADATDPEPPIPGALYILNKTDLLTPPDTQNALFVSAKTHQGLEPLKQAILKSLRKNPPAKDQITLTNTRHHQAIQAASKTLTHVISGLQDRLSPEFITSDLRAALEELGTILGTNITEELLSSIFSSFCVGK